MTKSRSTRSLMLCLVLVISSVALHAAADGAFPPATPESQGMSAEALAALSDVVKEYIENDIAVGAELLIIKNRHTVFHEYYGLRDRDRAGADSCHVRAR